MRKISRIEPDVPVIRKRKKVAAYARISQENERMMHSLSAQVSYYSEMIQKNPDWEYAGVYADSGISGTGMKNRAEFLRMLQDCEDGKIDIILTKSISRFARNTVDLLQPVRHLKEIGVTVRFEKENIDSTSGDGELMLTILASFAQEEAVSTSLNYTWARRKNFEKGKPQARFRVFGYRWDGWDLIVEPKEAEIVREIYSRYLNGDSLRSILDWLKAEGVKSSADRTMTRTSLNIILSNPLYKGDLVLQKAFVADPLTHHRKINRGELPQYVVKENHEAIVSPETFAAVQELRKKHKEEFYFVNNKGDRSCFTSKIRCGCCGKNYQRGYRKNPTTETYVFWACGKKRSMGAASCPSRLVPDWQLRNMCCKALGIEEFDEDTFNEQIEIIEVQEDKSMIFRFKDGHEVTVPWEATAKELAWNVERWKEGGDSADEECNNDSGDHKPDDADTDK